MAAEHLNTEDERLRGSIASKVLRYGTITLGIIAAIIVIAGIVLMIIAGSSEHLTEKATNLITGVFNSLLPVIATWVGTVIAFYFGKANFEAASKSAQDLVKQITNSDEKLKTIKVADKDVMRVFSDIKFNRLISEKEDKDILVQSDLLDFIDTNDKGERLPIFSEKNLLRYVIHESTLNEFLRKFTSGKFENLKPDSKKIEEITLQDLIDVKGDNDEMKNKVTKSAEFVSKTATLYEASQKLKANKYCQDVFVTDSGIPTEEVIGWVTNNKIAELAKL